MKVAINGFGRIGRNFLRTVLLDGQAQKHITIVVINIGSASVQSVAHSFKYDTLMGTFPGTVVIENDQLVINGTRIKIIRSLDPLQLPWKALDIDWVVECTGHFTYKKDAQKHCVAGARAVLISAPSYDADVSIIMGVNQAQFDAKRHAIVSLGSCTTNAVTPLLKVLNDTFGIQTAAMTTVHAYTNTQVLLDVEQDDVRRARAAALNIIPSTTGAMSAVVQVMPELSGKITGCSLRVPVAKVSIIDLAIVAEKPVSIISVHSAFEKAISGPMKGIMELSGEQLVSSDFSGNGHSVIIDTAMTDVIGSMVKVFGWYDNEWAYSERLKDFLVFVARQ